MWLHNSPRTLTTTMAELDDDLEEISLPDVEELGSRQYSGFLAVNRYEDEEVSDALHYWHVEAEHADPDEAPLVVWLTGGPGGSSVGAALTEHGVRTPARRGPRGRSLDFSNLNLNRRALAPVPPASRSS